ncbi:unnamed protein product [Lactuca saligna]|uniref:Uncharacterized protein n=1 Tax=Lactuca saligna TaxID=75948 RepID=A0AA35V1I8_LACSI|nr:unnamed protein product [Lactuca saligna]
MRMAMEYFELSRKGAALMDILAEMPKFLEREEANHFAELMLWCPGFCRTKGKIDNREEFEVGPDPDAVLAFTEPIKDIPIKRRGLPPKTPLPKDQEPVKDIPIPSI